MVTTTNSHHNESQKKKKDNRCTQKSYVKANKPGGVKKKEVWLEEFLKTVN